MEDVHSWVDHKYFVMCWIICEFIFNDFINSFCRVYNNEVVCECPESMDFMEDRKTCVVYDPCLNSVDDSSCRKTVDCEHGFIYNHDSETCEDINECLEGDKCQGGVCENTEGSFSCICHPGYKLTPTHSCVDIDECSTNNGNCSHKCVNYPSTYACSCPFGQILLEDDHTCGFADLCEPNNGGCSQICDYDEQKTFCSWWVVDEIDLMVDGFWHGRFNICWLLTLTWTFFPLFHWLWILKWKLDSHWINCWILSFYAT